MAGCWRGKMKRKDLEEVYDEFAEFSLSSPARKIKRLDAELPPIMEEGEPASILAFKQQSRQGNISAGASSMPNLGSVVSDDVPAYPSNNEERPIVLYRSVETPITLSSGPTNVSLSISSDFIHGLKNRVFKPGNQRFDEKDEKADVNSSCLAVVSWVPSQVAIITSEFGGSVSPSKSMQEPMEAEESEAASMEVEEVREQAITDGVGGEGFQQRQQHCMTPQLLPNTFSLIMWSR